MSINPESLQTLNNEAVSSEPTPAVEQTTVVTSWKDSLPEDIKSDSTLQDIKDITGLAKSYVASQRMLGNSVRIPGPDASPEARQEFYQKLTNVPGITRLPDPNDKAATDQFYAALGRPESPDKYNFELDQDVNLVPEDLQNFKELAHATGLTNEQANKLVAFESARAKAAEQAAMQSREQAVEALKSEWGNDFQNRLTGAKEMVSYYASKYPDAVNELINSPAGNNPALLVMLSELYSGMKEKGVVIPNSQSLNYGVSPEEAIQQINEIKENRNHPYWTAPAGSPEKEAALAKMSKLFQAAYPE